MTDQAAPLLPDPSAALVAAFTRIQHERMDGVPILNAALAVEAVGFRDWNGHWLGALVTPWFINLVVMPRDPAAWRAAPERATVHYPFPSGLYPFLAAVEPGLGEYHACSLFSPVLEFADQDAARETARVALEGLLAAPASGDAPAAAGGQTLSRRDFLRGASSAPHT